MGRLITPDDWRLGESWYEYRKRMVRWERRLERASRVAKACLVLFVFYCVMWMACGGWRP